MKNKWNIIEVMFESKTQKFMKERPLKKLLPTMTLWSFIRLLPLILPLRLNMASPWSNQREETTSVSKGGCTRSWDVSHMSLMSPYQKISHPSSLAFFWVKENITSYDLILMGVDKTENVYNRFGVQSRIYWFISNEGTERRGGRGRQMI